MTEFTLGGIVTIDGKRYQAEANMIQIITGENSCEGCVFQRKPGLALCGYEGSASLYCGGNWRAPDQQFILKEVS